MDSIYTKKITQNSMMCILIVLGIFATANPAAAQFEEMPLIGLEVYGEGMPEATFEKHDATITYTRGGISLSILTLGIDYTIDRYSWEKLDKLPFGNGKDAPWKNLHTLGIGGAYGAEINERWSYLAFLGGSAGFEDSFDEAYLNGIFAGGATYALTDAWNLIGGAGILYSNAPDIGNFSDLDIFSQFDDSDALPFPVLGAQWNEGVESGLSLSLIFPIEAKISYRSVDGNFSTSADAITQKADMSYQFTPNIGTTLSCALGNSVIHQLGKDNLLIPAGKEEAYLVSERGLVDLMLNFKLFEHMNLNIGPYYAFNQEISVRDKKDKSLHSLDTDDTFGGKFSLAVEF